MDPADDLGLGLDFDLVALGGAAQELESIAADYSAILDRIDLGSKATVLALQDQLDPLFRKAQTNAELQEVLQREPELIQLELAIDPVNAGGIPLPDDRKRVLGGFLPGDPGVVPVGSWNVWVRQTCVAEGLADIECLPLPHPQRPEGNGWSVCYGGVTQGEARAACGRICPEGRVAVADCPGPKPPGDPQPEPPTPEPPSEEPEKPKCSSCCCCPCECQKGSGSGGSSARYCLWRGPEPGQCEILEASQSEPPAPGWEKITCNDSREYLERLKETVCRASQPSQPPTQSPGGGLGSGSLCDPASWSSDQAAEAVTSLIGLLTGQTIAGQQMGVKLEGVLGFAFDALLNLLGLTPGGSWAKGLIDTITQAITGINTAALTATNCSSPDLAGISASASLLSVFEKWVGRLPPRWTSALAYAEAYKCPWLLPTSAEARSLFLTGVIPYDVAIRLGRFNGLCDSSQSGLIDASQSRLLPSEAVSALRRGLWSRERAEREIRARGYLDPQALALQEQLSQFVPGPSDLIRFVVRDAADQKEVDRFDLDAEFNLKYLDADPRIRAWAQAQGVPDEVVRFYWRAHWEIPSPTQLGEFWRRLRIPEAPDPAIAEEIGLTGSIPSWSPRFNPELRVGVDSINAALAQQDILPFWRNRFRETQYLPLTRVDVRRAYDLGIVGIDDVYESLIQDGYSNGNAATLAKFAYVEKRKGISSTLPIKQLSSGEISEEEAREELIREGYLVADVEKITRRISRKRLREAYSLPEFVDYVEGSIGLDDLKEELTDRLYTVDQIEEIIGRANRKIRVRFRAGCTEELQTRFNWGELDKRTAVESLKSLGWNDESARAMVESWACRRAVGDRLSTVRQLLTWLELGLISEKDFRDRSARLMIPRDDQNRILAQAVIRQEESLSKKAEARRKELERNMEKRAREAERKAKRDAAEAEKAAKKARSDEERAERIALMLEKAAISWAGFALVPLASASDLLGSLLQDGTDSYGLTAGASGKAVVQAVELAIKEGEKDLAGVFDLIASDVETNSLLVASDV